MTLAEFKETQVEYEQAMLALQESMQYMLILASKMLDDAIEANNE